MLAIAALTLKKTITLIALVGPFSMVPIFLATTAGFTPQRRARFARTIAFSVTVALLVAAFLGMPFLGILGVSLGAMQVGGGVIVLLLAIAMVLGKETTFKGSPAAAGVDDIDVRPASIVPLAVPLLAGPAAFSYVMGSSEWTRPDDLIHILVPILAVGIACWITFHVASQAGRVIRESTLDIVERVGGFVLAAMAAEMMATGLRSLFPILR